jgi:hypothetical protein
MPALTRPSKEFIMIAAGSTISEALERGSLYQIYNSPHASIGHEYPQCESPEEVLVLEATWAIIGKRPIPIGETFKVHRIVSLTLGATIVEECNPIQMTDAIQLKATEEANNLVRLFSR